MSKAFASQGDIDGEKNLVHGEWGKGSGPSLPRGIPNSGVIIGDDSVMVIEAQATPRLAEKVIEKIRTG